MLKGLLLKESLADLSALDLLHITHAETWQVDNPAPNQPPVWTALSFEVDDSQAGLAADRLSRALKPAGWFINASTESTVYVIFPGKVFQYAKGNAAQRALAVQHGRTLNIPDRQLDWSE